MASGNRKGIKGKLALAGWGMAGLFLAADLFMGGYPAVYGEEGQNVVEIAAAEAGGDAVWEEEQREEKYIALTFDGEVILEIN